MTLATFETTDLLFEETFETSPIITGGIVNGSYQEGTQTRLLMWIHEVTDQFLDALRAEQNVSQVNQLGSIGSIAFIRIEVDNEPISPLLEKVWSQNGAVLTIEFSNTCWEITVLMETHANLSEIFQYLHEQGHSPSIQQVGEKVPSIERGVCPLTDQQQEALELAYRLGYFEIPRRASLVDVANEFGISDQAASERIRRGIDALIEMYLGNEDLNVNGEFSRALFS